MSTPEPLDCLDQCPSPLRCNDTGRCRKWVSQGAREYEEALRSCREQGIRDPFRKDRAA